MPIRLRGVRIDIDFRLAWTGEIAIHKRAPDFAPAAANVLAEAVIGQEIANVRVGHEDHVAVEINCIAAMSDGPHRLRQIFHKRDAQAVDHRLKFKLPGLHLPDSFRLQNGIPLQSAILKKREHEARHISGRR